MSAPLAFLSLLAELAFGYPDRLFRAIGHPVTWIGGLVDALDRALNLPRHAAVTRKRLGVAALVALIVVVGSIAAIVQYVLLWLPFGLVLLALAAGTLLAQRSLGMHVAAVAQALGRGGLDAGRKAVSQIVGRDPERLDEAAVCRAAIESLAENFSDGVVAPAFWLTLGGLPGIAAYKAVNTADSMIGHKTPRHQAFGWAAARFDDLVNLPGSRLTALLLVVAAAIVPGADWREAWRAVGRDARRHRSPNAGWPEAAMAGALGLALAGPRHYGGILVDDATMGNGRRAATAADIRRALKLYWTADLLLVALIAAVALFTWHA